MALFPGILYSDINPAFPSPQRPGGETRWSPHNKGEIAHKSVNESKLMHVAGMRNSRSRLELWPKETARRFSGFIFAYLWDNSDIGAGQEPSGSEMTEKHSLHFYFLRLRAPDCRAK